MKPLLPPSTPESAARVGEALRRERLLYGQADGDVRAALHAILGRERASHINSYNLGSSPYAFVCQAQSALYSEIPSVRGAPVAATDALVAAGHWERAARIQRDTIALRNMAVLVSLTNGILSTREIPPSLIYSLRARRDNPGAIGEISVWIESETEWELWRIDVEAQVYEVLDQALRPLRRFVGEAFPWRRLDGVAFCPVVLYEAASVGIRLDWTTGSEFYQASMLLVVMSTILQAAFNDASWAQRYIINGKIKGFADPATGANVVPGDPASVLTIESLDPESAVPPQVGQWSSPVDLAELQRMVAEQERDVCAKSGLRVADVTRSEANVRSMASIAVSREAVIGAQRAYAPSFAARDRELVCVVAWLLGLPCDARDVRVRYKSTARPLSELREAIAAAKEGLEAGLLTERAAYAMVHDHLSETEVDEDLAELDEAARLADGVKLAADGGMKAADTALNGAQVGAAQSIVTAVATRQLPRDSGLAQLQEFFNLSPEAADRILGSVGSTFFVEVAQ